MLYTDWDSSCVFWFFVRVSISRSGSYCSLSLIFRLWVHLNSDFTKMRAIFCHFPAPIFFPMLWVQYLLYRYRQAVRELNNLNPIMVKKRFLSRDMETQGSSPLLSLSFFILLYYIIAAVHTPSTNTTIDSRRVFSL